jgi:hypothetical protein
MDTGGAAFENHVVIAGSNPRVAGIDSLAGFALVDGDGGSFVEPLGKQARE